jgi:hypothetical protein
MMCAGYREGGVDRGTVADPLWQTRAGGYCPVGRAMAAPKTEIREFTAA